MTNNAMEEIKAGQTVMIFHDPITRKNKEGLAKIMEIHNVTNHSDGTQYACGVEFPDEFGAVYFRTIFCENQQ